MLYGDVESLTVNWHCENRSHKFIDTWNCEWNKYHEWHLYCRRDQKRDSHR